MNRHRTSSSIHQRLRAQVIFVFLLVLLVGLACTFSVPGMDTGQSSAQEESIHATQVALDVKSTIIAQQEAQLAQASTQAASQPQPPTAQPTQTPPPPATATVPPPTQAAVPTEAPAAPPPAEPSPTPDMDQMIKGAKILLYEDIAGYYELNRWVRDALNGMDLKYTDVGDAVGNFKAEMLSGTKWDLIIAAAESRKAIQGEFYDYLTNAANHDVAIIIETWYMDTNAGRPVDQILSRCGIAFQKNWMKPDRDSRSIIWLEPDHTLFHTPNEGFSLVHYSPYWEGDAGDLLMKKSSGDGELLAGLYLNEKGRYGTIATCMDGRVIVQTVSTHDYLKNDMIALWQNYISYTLKNHFQKVNSLP